MAADKNWTPAESLSFLAAGSQQLALAVDRDALHLVWVEAKTLYHSRLVGSAWQAPVKIAGGEQPALAIGADGALYCVSANWFLGKRDIYLSTWTKDRWSLSQVVSRTDGDSSHPVVCVAPNGIVHVAWTDTTPGYSVVYHGVKQPEGWTYEPVPSGKGSAPSLTANGDAVYVAWQDRLASSPTGAFEVLVTSKRAAEWSLPAMVSDSRDFHSLLPCVAAGATNRCHLVWQEERDDLYVIRHTDLWPNGWEEPFDVSDPAVDARLARAMVNPLGLFQFLWSEGGVLRHRVRAGEPQGSWWEPETACEGCVGLDEIAAAIAPGGELHAVLSCWADGGGLQHFHLKRKALERKKVLLPVVSK